MIKKLSKKSPKIWLPNYKKGFEILIDYWECLPDEIKPEIDKKLKKLGL